MVSPDGAMVMAGLSAKRVAQSWTNAPSVVLGGMVGSLLNKKPDGSGPLRADASGV